MGVHAELMFVVVLVGGTFLLLHSECQVKTIDCRSDQISTETTEKSGVLGLKRFAR